MYAFRRLGFHITKFINSIGLTFRFFGHLFHSTTHIASGHLSISLYNMVEIIYYSGPRLLFPLLVICALLGMSSAQSAYLLLSPFHLQHQAFSVAQNVVTHELLPLLLGFILCIQAALNLINTRIKRISQTPEEVILDHILPIIGGMNITSLILYTYTTTVIFISFFVTFHFILNMTTSDFLIQVTSSKTLFDLIYSACKTLSLTTIVSLASGYYYYEAAVRHLSLRKAVSRTMTRGSFWLVVVSIYITFIF